MRYCCVDIAVVSADWLWHCDWRWERVDERLFLLDVKQQLNLDIIKREQVYLYFEFSVRCWTWMKSTTDVYMDVCLYVYILYRFYVLFQ